MRNSFLFCIAEITLQKLNTIIMSWMIAIVYKITLNIFLHCVKNLLRSFATQIHVICAMRTLLHYSKHMGVHVYSTLTILE